MDLDDPKTSIAHRDLIKDKVFLKRLYEDNYKFIVKELKAAPESIQIELGSGGGFLHEIAPHILPTDVVPIPGLEAVFSADAIPFADQSLSGICMMDVFHHLSNVELFLEEVERCLCENGRLVMIEPANTPWSRFVFQNFHHEPFDPTSSNWRIGEGGRLSHANGALPWIVFVRDRKRFEKLYPTLKIELIENFCPFRYLLSGGVSIRQLVPSWSYSWFHSLERFLGPLQGKLGMFMKVVVSKRSGEAK